MDGSDSSGSREEVGDGARVRNVGGRNLGLRGTQKKKKGKKVREEDGRRPESEGREGNVR